MSLRSTSFALLAVPVLALLAGCQPPPPRPVVGASRTDAAAAAYCRQRAQEVYEAQNRGSRLSIDQRDTPFSGAYLPNSETRGLSERYAMDAMIADCIRNSANRGQSTDAVNTPQAPAANAPARSARPADLKPAAPSGERAAKPLDRAPPPPPPVR